MSKLNIGFLTSSHMADFLKGFEAELNNFCRITYLILDDPGESLQKYVEYKSKVDCFVFSGRLLYFTVSEKIRIPEVPCYVIDEFEGDIASLLLKQVLINRDLDFSRIYVDCALEVNHFLGLKELLPEESLPYFNNFDFQDINTFIAKIRNRHLNLHETGQIELSITRSSYIAAELEHKGFSCLYLYPVKEFVLNFFMQIIHSQGKGNPIDNISSIISVDIHRKKTVDSEESFSTCVQMFATLGDKEDYDFIIQRKGGLILITTQFTDISKLTQDFTSCTFKKDFEEALGRTISIGIGMGYDLFQARRNSMKALDLSRKKSGDLYNLDAQNNLTGPIGSSKSTKIQSYPDLKLITLSKKMHIDHINLQKIIAFHRLNRSEPFSAEQLADYLHVTIRSASRLISKIEEYGGAESYRENISSARGRPKKYFKITFL